jgi:hypothetical protein
VHWNLSEHPTAEWTIQQFRNGLALDATYRFVVHDRDGIFAPAVDDALHSMSLQALRTPVRAPQAAEPAQTGTITVTELRFNPGNLQLYLGATGVRFNPWRTVLATANLLFPLTNADLRDRVTPAVGIDYVF